MSEVDDLFGRVMQTDASADPSAGEGATPAEGQASAELLSEDMIAGDCEWYMAIDGNQVGPVTPSEVARNLREGDLNAQSLVWHPEFRDWTPLEEVPQFNHLTADDPLTAAAVKTSTEATAGAVETSAVKSAAAAQPVAWKPSAAQGLATLVEYEMESLAPVTLLDTDTATTTGASASGSASFSVPGFAGVDLFPEQNAAALQMPRRDLTYPGVGQAIAPGWDIPRSRSASVGGGSNLLHMLLGGMAAAIIALVTVVVVLFAQRSPDGFDGFSALTNLVRGGLVAEQTHKGAMDRDTQDPKAKDPGTPAGPAAAARLSDSKEPSTSQAAPSPTAPALKKVPAVTKSAVAPARRPSAPRKARTASKPIKARLEIKDIVAGVKANASKLGHCIQKVQRTREIPPGRYKFVLDWYIRPNGTVSSGRLKGPARVLDSSLPSCFALGMRKWRFPASRKASPIRNFPFGPVVVR